MAKKREFLEEKDIIMTGFKGKMFAVSWFVASRPDHRDIYQTKHELKKGLLAQSCI